MISKSEEKGIEKLSKMKMNYVFSYNKKLFYLYYAKFSTCKISVKTLGGTSL